MQRPKLRILPKPVRTKALAPRPQASMQALSEQFGIEIEDKFKITGSSGFISLNVEKADGRVLSHKFKANKNFRQMTVYNKSDIGIEERREIVEQLDKDGYSQSAIANQIGMSQATVSLDLKKIRSFKKKKSK